MLISPEPPKWAEETLGESEDYFGNMTKAVTHPLETLEAMAQNLNDTYEVEGLEYMGGYVIGDIVVGELSAAAVSKAVGKGAGAVDDIGNIANKADDVADIAETAGKMDDIAEIAETAGKADDVAKIADDIGDFYDDIYRGCYDEPFNPIEEGAILDPDDIADIAADVMKGDNKTPAQMAKSWQGSGKYPGIDNYKDITLKKGKVIYRGEPNGTEYFTTSSAIERSGRNATTIFEGLQVEKNPIHGYRGTMQGYILKEDVYAAFGITKANPQFGKGGLPQIFVPDVQDLIDKGILESVDEIPLIK